MIPPQLNSCLGFINPGLTLESCPKKFEDWFPTWPHFAGNHDSSVTNFLKFHDNREDQRFKALLWPPHLRGISIFDPKNHFYCLLPTVARGILQALLASLDIWKFPKRGSPWAPPNHPKVGHLSIETHGDLGIPHDLRTPHISTHRIFDSYGLHGTTRSRHIAAKLVALAPKRSGGGAMSESRRNSRGPIRLRKRRRIGNIPRKIKGVVRSLSQDSGPPQVAISSNHYEVGTGYQDFQSFMEVVNFAWPRMSQLVTFRLDKMNN
jgi:hypothetical protein